MGSLVFDKIRLVGFKSFVEPTDFLIESGLTGIVGPNGCGKSNLLEAIRWVMGANSAKAMRAAGMDDVIFNGSKHRPARNQAHVTLTVNNAARVAPAEYNDEDVLEVTRIINKGGGSKYQINGRTVRAKDVQLLFADASTGANSPALVRQGQINDLISAKSSNRRRILEEAAGITGLHSRRHEAELRLRAAETNLSRLDDVIGQIESQLLSLRRQSRQAERYKRLAGEIREYRALLWMKRWEQAISTLTQSQTDLAACETTVQDLAVVAAEKTRVAVELAEGLEPKREEQLIAAAVLARLNEAKEQLVRDEHAAEDELDDLKARVEQIAADVIRETGITEDADTALTRLEIEQDTLAGLDDIGAALEEAQARAQETLVRRDDLEQEHDQLTRNIASATARRDSHKRELDRHQRRRTQLDDEIRKVDDRIADLEGNSDGSNAANLFVTASTDALKALEAAQKVAQDLETTRSKIDKADQDARDAFSTARQKVTELKAEQSAIEAVLSRGSRGQWTPVVSELDVSPGYEVALATALGDDLDAGSDAGAPMRWTGGKLPTQSLPGSVEALSEHVRAPDILLARLSQIGVADDSEIDRLKDSLLPGQRLVTKAGKLVRWDGFVTDAGVESAAAARLAYKNRLTEVHVALSEAQTHADSAKADADTIRAEREAATRNLAETRKGLSDLERQERASRAALMQYETDVARDEAERRSLTERRERSQAEITEVEAAVTAAETALAEANANLDTDMIEKQARLKSDLAKVRADADEANAAFRTLRNESESRKARLDAIGSERADWAKRATQAKERLAQLEERQVAAQGALQAATEGPDRFSARREKLFHELSQAEERRKVAADRLAVAEREVKIAVEESRQSEAAYNTAREARAGADARLTAARERVEETKARIDETLSCEPSELGQYLGALAPESKLSDSDIERKLERLQNERERMGGVNLRADVEVEEQESRLSAMSEERADLVAAIARLREGIDELNSEGRRRLLEAFDVVNGHFGRLFTTLFGGGEAALALTESDDPLEAGLEIMVSPPGKKLGSMSLMSGGEQALTATALIFAVFLSNPAPICVLDEVDAPLDDANVARYCNLLDEMTKQTKTKFIAITHNAVTMSRMDRLFGVTMAERGVSQLVSMELSGATRLVAAE